MRRKGLFTSTSLKGIRYHLRAQKEYSEALDFFTEDGDVDEFKFAIEDICADLAEGVAKYGEHTLSGAALARKAVAIRKDMDHALAGPQTRQSKRSKNLTAGETAQEI